MPEVVAMTDNDRSFEQFLQKSRDLHQAGLEKYGKPYKLHSNQVLTSVFCTLIDRLGVTVAIEVGAFRAEFSRSFMQGGSNRTALAVEANPYNYNAFKDQLETEGVIYHHAAVNDIDGPCELQLSSTEQDQESGFIRGNNSIRTAASRTETRPLSVPGTTLDTLVAGYVESRALPPIVQSNTVLWIDAEGALDLVIRGGQQTIRGSAAIYTEVEAQALWDGQSDFGQITELLADVGFWPYLRDCEYEPDQFNVIYINERLGEEQLLAELQNKFENELRDFG